MKERKTIIVEPDVLLDFMDRLLCAVGCEPSAAKIAAEIFLEADMRGVGFQGLDHMHTMIGGIRNGHIDPLGMPRIAKEGAAFALIDGNRGPGQIAAVLAVDVAVAKARKAGVCCVGIVNSSDIFMLGYYAERIARAGLVGFVFTSAPPSVHPFGGRERIMGTNPLAISFPTAGKNPVLIDMATSALSYSNIRQASYFEDEIPDNVGVNANGQPTNSATKIREGGAISPLGGHKGFALSLAVALLSGPMVGAQVGQIMSGWRSDKKGPQGICGHFLLAIDPSCFGKPQAFREATSAYLNEIKESKKAIGFSEIRIPGSRGFETRERSVPDGVLIYEVVWKSAARLAGELGVAVPQLNQRR